MSTHSPTDEQAAIYTEATTSEASLMLQAYAGCGKTSTIEGITKRINPNIPGLALAFNTRIKEELTARLPQTMQIKTLNGLGHAAWGKALGKKLTIVDGKLAKICRQTAREAGYAVSEDELTDLRELVTKAMQVGLVHSAYPHKGLVPDTPEDWLDVAERHMLDTPIPAMIDLARECLRRNTAMAFAGEISFDDQIYCSALLGGIFPRFPLVLADEAQDLSPLNHIQLRRVAAGRLIAVGDSRQSIYAFRGADSNSMTNLKALRQQWTDLPLTLTFRCPKVVVARQQKHAPGFRAADGNPEGHFGILGVGGQVPDLGEIPWKWSEVEALAPPGPSPIAVLCRNNAPIIALAFRLIRMGKGVTVLGRDIGASLTTLSKKLFPEDGTPALKCISAIVEWRTKEIDLAKAAEKENKVEVIRDRADSLMAVAEGDGIRDAGDIRNALYALFSPKVAKITLASIHKSKGLEWPLVLHLDPWRVPSKAALQQEQNLKYVLETRSQGILLEANLESLV